MALAGITAVGEFHYLHHGPGGRRYADPNAMGEAVVEAAGEAGIRVTLIDACYLHGGIGREPDEAQLRFSDGSAAAWAERVERLRPGPGARIGAAIHSVRAVDPAAAAEVAAWARERAAPLHAHLSEQPAENEACLSAHGMTPAALLAEAGAVDERFTAIHATHLAEADFGRLGEARASICLCPTTERDLADGVGPARRLAEAGAALCLGSDSNAVIDLFEEARAVEMDERLASGRPRPPLRPPPSAGGDRGRPCGDRLARGGPDRAGSDRRPGHDRPRLAPPRRDGARARPRLGPLRRARRRRPQRRLRRA